MADVDLASTASITITTVFERSTGRIVSQEARNDKGQLVDLPEYPEAVMPVTIDTDWPWLKE